jgi:hypothetical protein
MTIDLTDDGGRDPFADLPTAAALMGISVEQVEHLVDVKAFPVPVIELGDGALVVRRALLVQWVEGGPHTDGHGS